MAAAGAPIEAVTIARRGAALEVTAGGATRLVRRVDLTAALGEPRAGEPRFAAARIDGDGVVVDYEGGADERIEASALIADATPTLVIDDAGVLLTCEGDPGDPLGIMRDAAVVCGGGRILWLGPRAELDRCGLAIGGTPRLAAGGRLVSPGLIDCHAHPVFAGNRADEFGWRAAGRSYLDIGAVGGGIQATVEPTRAASFDELVELTAARIARALAAGTTTCEAKSGYDLTVDGELRMLEVARVLDALQPVDLSPTLLGAHVLPAEYAGDRAGFVTAVAEQMIPQAAARGLADAVDVYCDQNAFTLEETRRILEAGKRADLLLRAHAGQFADLGAARLLADLGGVSADHVENVSDADIATMAAHGVAAVMLPGACVQLRMAIPPIERFRAAGVAMAVATDMNPGTSMCETLPVQLWLATTHYGMTVEEGWLGVTRIAARVLGRHDIGVLAEGARADLVLWNAETPAEIPYRYGANLVDTVIKDGRPL